MLHCETLYKEERERGRGGGGRGGGGREGEGEGRGGEGEGGKESLGMVVHTCKPPLRRQIQEEHQFTAPLDEQ